MMRNRYVAALLLLTVVLAGCAGKASRKADAPAAKPAPATSTGSAQPSYQSEKSAPATSKPAPAPVPQSPPTDMQYRDYGNNPTMSTAVQPVSTFGVDVDTASYTLARSHLNQNMLPPQEAIRAEEFINYFPQNYPNPTQTVGVTVEGSVSPFRSQTHIVQIGLKAHSAGAFTRKSANLTFVIDTSGSMADGNRLELVKDSLQVLVNQLDRDDRVAIVKYSTRAEVVIGHTNDKKALNAAIEQLRPDASTNAEAGLRLGYQVAAEAFREGVTNRVILASDGVANVGNTSPDGILRTVADYKARGIGITAIGVGMGNYNDVLLEQLADKGDGTYHYVDDLAEARKIFSSQLSSTLDTVAKDVKVQVRFYPEQVVSYRLVGYENRVMSNDQFRNDYKDSGDMGAGHEVTALYEVQLKGSGPELGSVSLRYKDVASGEVVERSFPISRSEVKMTTQSAYARIRWTAAVAEFAGILGANPWASETRLADVLAVARRAAGDLDNPPAHKEALQLMEKALALRR